MNADVFFDQCNNQYLQLIDNWAFSESKVNEWSFCFVYFKIDTVYPLVASFIANLNQDSQSVST